MSSHRWGSGINSFSYQNLVTNLYGLVAMKILLLTTLVALAAADVSHLNNGYHYQAPSFQTVQTSYGAPQSSVLGNGASHTISYSSGSSNQHLSLPSASGPSLQFNGGYSSTPSSVSATVQTFENGGFSTPKPISAGELASLQASNPSSNVDYSNIQVSTPSSIGSGNFAQYQQPSSSYQFLSKLNQPTVSTFGISGSQFGSDSALNSGFGQSSGFGQGSGFGQSSGFEQSSFSSGLGKTSFGQGSFNSGLEKTSFSSGFGQGSLNSGFGSSFNNAGSQFVSKTSGGSINEAFGVSTDAGHSNLTPEVSKHLYFFAAPEEEEQAEARVNLPPVAPKKTYKIIFIKAPTYRNQAAITVPAAPQNEEKTLVYVLVKKPEANANVRFQQAAAPKPSKPEVFFIKYKTQKEAEEAVAEIQAKHGASGQVIANLPAGQSITGLKIQGEIGVSSTPSTIGYSSGDFGSSGQSIGVSSPSSGSFGSNYFGVSSTPSTISYSNGDFGSSGQSIGVSSPSSGSFGSNYFEQNYVQSSTPSSAGISYFSSTPSSVGFEGVSQVSSETPVSIGSYSSFGNGASSGISGGQQSGGYQVFGHNAGSSAPSSSHYQVNYQSHTSSSGSHDSGTAASEQSHSEVEASQGTHIESEGENDTSASENAETQHTETKTSSLNVFKTYGPPKQ